jgi:hypothetical protein
MNSKAAQERQQRILLDLVRQPGNDVCADCKGRAPRWASWNLGIFICVQCAGVHRKMGVHISKVKSITLDTWTREQVDRMKEMGNLKSNRIFNPDEMRNRPPTNMEESERDSELEKYIRRKYEFRRFMEGRPPPVPTKDATFLTSPPASSGRSRSPVPGVSEQRNLAQGSSIARSRTAPIPSTWSEAQRRVGANAPPLPPGTKAFALPTAAASSQPTLQLPSGVVPQRTSSALDGRNGSSSAASRPAGGASAQSSVFDDLISLGEPSSTPTTQQPALQMNPWAAMQAQQQAVLSAPAIQEPSGNFWSASSSGGGASPASPFGVSPSGGTSLGSMRALPQHASTLPVATPPQGLGGVSPGMLSPGGMFPQYQQQRSASLGSMAFSTSPIASPGYASSNPFNTMQYASTVPQQQSQQLGQAAFGQQTMAAPFYGQQVQQQAQPQQQGQFGQFQSSMMPNAYGQSQQQPFVQQNTQHSTQFGNMW